MLAGHLISIAEDLLEDYARLRVVEVLTDAVNLAAERPNLNDSQYQERVKSIKAAAQRMLDTSIVKSYPIGLKRKISHSGFSQSLPEAIARMLLVGFSDRRKTASISSAELKMHLDEAASFRQQMSHLVNASAAFGVEKYVTPEGTACLEVSIPDPVYDRELAKLPKTIERLEAFLNVIEELVTGSRGPHRILWLSTTDLVISIPMALAVIGGVMLAYERLLGIAEKQLNVLKLIRDLRKVQGTETGDLESKIKETVKIALAETVKEIVEHLGAEREKSRRNELEIELKAVSLPLVTDLGAGLRFAHEAHYEHEISSSKEGNEGEAAAKRLEQRQEQELRVDMALKSLEQDMAALLTSEFAAKSE